MRFFAPINYCMLIPELRMVEGFIPMNKGRKLFKFGNSLGIFLYKFYLTLTKSFILKVLEIFSCGEAASI